MVSPQATLLTRQHRQQLATLALAVSQRITALTRSARLDDIDTWWDSISAQALALVLRGADAATILAEQYLTTHARLEGVTLTRPVRERPDRAQIETSLHVTGPVAFKKHILIGGDPLSSLATMRTTLTGSTQRLVMDGSRSTVMRTFADRSVIEGWRRVTGGSPCAFCAMLASRGGVYSRRSVSFPAHDKCACSAEPLYRQEPNPPRVQKLADDWERVTEGKSGADAMRAWRQYWDSRKTTTTSSGGDATAASRTNT